MSFNAVAWVLHNSKERLGNRLVLLVLAQYARADGTKSCPGVKTIAAEALLSERNVQYCLRELERSGAIRKTGTSEYRTASYDVLGVQVGVQNSAENVSDFAPDTKANTKNRVQNLHPWACACGIRLKTERALLEHIEVLGEDYGHKRVAA